MDWESRYKVLSSIKYIDRVFSFEDDDDTACVGLAKLKILCPNDELYFANGGDRNEKTTPELEYCMNSGIKPLFSIGGDKIASSSSLLQEFKSQDIVKRDWGYWRVLKNYTNVKVKELVVYPESKLSFQKHEFRNELWVCQEGIASVVLENKEFKLLPQEHCIIKRNEWHQLVNPSKFKEVRIVEIQFGAYCTETDIERK